MLYIYTEHKKKHVYCVTHVEKKRGKKNKDKKEKMIIQTLKGLTVVGAFFNL
jgi:hypothetical protein